MGAVRASVVEIRIAPRLLTVTIELCAAHVRKDSKTVKKGTTSRKEARGRLQMIPVSSGEWWDY